MALSLPQKPANGFEPMAFALPERHNTKQL
jgi:hypothetical protein